MMRLHTVVFIVFVCGLIDVRGDPYDPYDPDPYHWSNRELDHLTENLVANYDFHRIFCCDWNGNAVETWCGTWNGWTRNCCDTCFWYSGRFTDCRPTVYGSTWTQRRQATDHCRRAFDDPWYCHYWGRKKRFATSNETIVSPTLSGIKKDREPPIKTDFNTTMPGMSGNRKPPTDPFSNNTITWMSGIKKKWNLKGKKTMTWDAGTPRVRNPPNITDPAYNQMILKKKQQSRNGFNCGSSPVVDAYHCRRVRTRSQMRYMQCPCCLVKGRAMCGSVYRCPC